MKKNFDFYLWGVPFLGGFLSLILGFLMGADNCLAIVVLLGIISGYLLLISLILAEKFLKE